MSEPWKEILIDVEPRGKEFRLGIDEDATIGDILGVIVERCEDEGIDIKKWAKREVGSDYQFVMLRKAEGNAMLPPGIPLGEIEPEIQNSERFKLATQAVVGGLPPVIFNRRINCLIDEFYSSDLKEIYQKEGWTLQMPEKKDLWDHPQFPLKVIKKYSDGAYKILRFNLLDFPGLVSVSGDKLELAFKHSFRFNLPREYPQNLGKIDIISETALFHPRITAAGTKACYTVNGEVGRILIDIIFNVLLRPETVRPPSIYRDADWGLDSRKMQWYIKYGPEKIYTYLRDEWKKKQQGELPKPKKKGKFKFLIKP